MGNSKKKAITNKIVKTDAALLHKKENQIIIAVVAISIIVFAAVILILDASITGMVIRNSETGGRIDDLFFVLLFLGTFVFLASVVYYAHSLREEK
jgi:hypothetical protein